MVVWAAVLVFLCTVAGFAGGIAFHVMDAMDDAPLAGIGTDRRPMKRR